MDTSILDPWPWEVSINKGILQMATWTALKSDYKFKMGCVIFKGKRIISSGRNQIRSCYNSKPQDRKFINSLHAELAAILNSPSTKVLKGASILVVKISKTLHSFSNSKPCEYCMNAISYCNIKKIYYFDETGNLCYEKI